MKRLLKKYKAIFIVVITIIQSVVLGVYLSLIATYISNGGRVIKALLKVPYAEYFIFVFLFCIFFQIYLEIKNGITINENNKRLIDQILKSACDSFVYPHKNYHIRAMITMCDYKRNVRKVVYGYNITASPERDSEYAIDFGVTGEAIKKKIPVAEELPENHISTYEQQYQLIVEPRLKSILAAPIFSVEEKDKVIGVIAFDSMEPMDKIKFNTDYSKELAQSWADIIAVIIDN